MNLKKAVVMISFMAICFCVGVVMADENTFPVSLPDYDFGNVIMVNDGDTVKINMHYRGEQTFRILGIDAYETRKIKRFFTQIEATGLTVEEGLAKGQEARKIVQDLVDKKEVFVVFGDRRYGVYGRPLGAVLFVKDGKIIELGDYLLKTYPTLFFKATQE